MCSVKRSPLRPFAKGLWLFFQVFRSVLQLTPPAVFLQAEHRPLVLEHLATFAGSLSAPDTRCGAMALGVQLAHRAHDMAFEVFQVLGRAQATTPLQQLHFGVASGVQHWRRYFLRPEQAQAALQGDSEALRWMIDTFADQAHDLFGLVLPWFRL